MKKLSKVLLVFLLVLCIGSLLVACDDPAPTDPVVTSITVSGQKTAFLTGDDFSIGDMVVTITYDDDSTAVATADQYTVDSSAYVKDTAGNYTIKVSLNDTAFETSYTVVVSNRTYSVVAGSGVTILSGVSNGTTLLGETITFKAVPASNKHLVAVKVNGTAVDADADGIYSISTSTYLTSISSAIQITVEDDVHSHQTVVTAPKCDEGGYTTYTCSCGDSYVADETTATNLIADLSRWNSEAMSLEAIDGGVKATQSKDDTWYYNEITLAIDVESDKYLVLDFDSLTGNNVAVQFLGKDDACKKVMTVNGRYAYALEDLGITESGSYTLNVYIEGAQGTSFVIRELSLVGAQDATVHNYGSATQSGSGACHASVTSSKVCADCGAVHTDVVDEAKFLMANTGLWAGPALQLSYANNVATLVPKGDPSWGGSVWREVTLKTTDYIRFAGTGTFKVELKSATASEGTVIIAEKQYNGEVVIVPVSSVVTENGTYTIIVYGIGAKDSVHTVNELFVLSSADENVHAFGEWTEDGDSRTHSCSVCGVSEIQNKVSVTFNADNGSENAVVKVWPGEKVSDPETAPTKQGYVFSKWQLNDADFSFDTAITESITLKAVYAPATDTAYKVEYYGQKKADGSYTLLDTKNEVGTTGATVNAVTTWQPTDTELKYNSAHELNVLEGVVLADGSLVLKVYYSYEFTVTFKKGETVAETKTVAWGEKVTAADLDSEAGYTFAWMLNDVAFDFNTEIKESITLTQSKLAATNTEYKVEYYVQSKADGTYSVAKTDNAQGTTGTVATASAAAYTPSDSELVQDADHASNVLSGAITADGSLVLKVYYSYEFTVTFQKTGSDDVTKKVAWGGKVEAETLTPVAGYTLAWNKDGSAFDFNTEIKESITLVYSATANTDTAYTVNVYIQQEDGSYELDAKSLTGTTDTTVTLDGSEYSVGDYLFFDAEHEGTVLSGTIAGDGSLELTIYYSYVKVVAYDVSDLGGKAGSIEVTFDGVADNTSALLEVRNAANEVQDRVWSTVTGGVATFNTEFVDLEDAYCVITVDGNVNPTITNIQAKDVALTVNVAEEMARSSTPPDFTLSHGIHIYGVDKTLLNSDGYIIKPNYAVLVFNPNDFDYLKVVVKGMSTSAVIGADVYSKTSGNTGDKFIFTTVPTNGVVTTFEATVQKSQLASDPRGYYIACKTLGNGDFATGYIGFETVTYYKNSVALTQTILLDVNGKGGLST